MTNEQTSVVLTGATGFLGRHLINELLKTGYRVIALVRDDRKLRLLQPSSKHLLIESLNGPNVKLINILERSKPKFVIHVATHFAVEHKYDEIGLLWEANVIYANRLLEAMAKSGTRYLVNTSSYWQDYNNQINSPANLYAATKNCFEAVIDYYSTAYDIKSLTLNHYDIYGPKDTRKKIIQLLWEAVDSKKIISLSPGNQNLRLVYVADAISAYLKALEILPNQKCRNTKYSISSTGTITLRALVELFEEITQTNGLADFGGRPYRLNEFMNPQILYPILPGWTPKIALRDGILACKPN